MRQRTSILVAAVLICCGNSSLSIGGANQVDEESSSGSDATAEATPLERNVSLNAEDMPLRKAFAEICRQAGVPLELDEGALAARKLDLEEPVTISIDQEHLADALSILTRLSVDWRFAGVVYEIRDGKLVIGTMAAKQARIRQQLPDWLAPLYKRGLLADVDDDGAIVSITASEIVDDALLAQVATLPQLRKLQIDSTRGITSEGIAHLAQMTALEQLSVSSVNFDGNGLGDEIAQEITGLERLTDLSIGECGITDAGVRLLSEMQQITRLELRQEGRLTDAALASVAKMKGLRYLDLSSYVGTEHYGWMRFSADAVRQLASLQQLEELHLVGHDVPADALAFDKLTSLSLGGRAVDDACAKRIAECSRLKSLALSYTAITDAGLEQIATLPELARLDIDSHVITDNGIAHLTKLRNLEHLSLRASQLSDESLTHLAQIQTLTQLDLHGSGFPGAARGERFTVDGLTRLRLLRKLRSLSLTNLRSPDGYIGLKALSQLRVLSFLMCDIDADEGDALAAALPSTMIYGATSGRTIRPRN